MLGAICLLCLLVNLCYEVNKQNSDQTDDASDADIRSEQCAYEDSMEMIMMMVYNTEYTECVGVSVCAHCASCLNCACLIGPCFDRMTCLPEHLDDNRDVGDGGGDGNGEDVLDKGSFTLFSPF